MWRRITDDHARANRWLWRVGGVGRRILDPRELRECEAHRCVHALWGVAATVGRKRPKSRARFFKARGEIPRLRFPLVGLVAVADDTDAHAFGHAAEEFNEIVDGALRVGDFAPHA